MSFFVVCFGLVTLISAHCYLNGRARDRQPSPSLTDKMQEYRDFETMVVQLVEVSAATAHERRSSMEQFYKDHPPPNYQEQLKRTLRAR